MFRRDAKSGTSSFIIKINYFFQSSIDAIMHIRSCAGNISDSWGFERIPYHFDGQNSKSTQVRT